MASAAELSILVSLTILAGQVTPFAMANRMYLYINRANIPSRAEWQAALERERFPLELSQGFVPSEAEGVYDCRLFGEDIEIQIDTSDAPYLDFDEGEGERFGKKDFFISFRWGSSSVELVAILFASYILVKHFDGIASFEGEDPESTDVLASSILSALPEARNELLSSKIFPRPLVEDLGIIKFDRFKNFRFVGFLLKQPFTFVPGIFGALAAIGLGLSPNTNSLIVGESGNLFIFIYSVLAFGTVGVSAGFIGFRIFRHFRYFDQSQIKQPAILKWKATQQSSDEVRAGTLILKTKEWIFAPDRYSVRRDAHRFPRDQIRRIQIFKYPDSGIYPPTSGVKFYTHSGLFEFILHDINGASEIANLSTI